MKILHLSDYHYKSHSYSKFDQDNVIEKFITRLGDKEIDFIFFTGDLVHNGSQDKHFYEAFESFIKKIKVALNIEPYKIFLCPGNHDIDRTQVLPSLNAYFDTKILNGNDLNSFISVKGVDYENSIKPSKNYNEFSSKFYGNSDHQYIDHIHELYSAHMRPIGERQVGIVAINSAWRSFSDNDEGNLLFPEALIKEALNLIADAQCKILLVHHPLHWFKTFNYIELQNLIHKSFTMLFSGHVHQEHISTHFLANNGIFSHISPAVLTYEKDKILGYSVINFDLEEADHLTIEKLRYGKNEGCFYDQEKVFVNIPCGPRKQKQNKIRQKVIGKYDVELARSNELLLNNIDEENLEKFIEMFNNPVLKKNSNIEFSAEDNLIGFSFEKLFNNENNYIILGKDKSGKTSALKRVQLHHLKNYAKNGNVPFYIDYNEYDTTIINEGFDIIKLIRNYYETNYADAISFINEHSFRLLIDNFDQRKPLTGKIVSFLEAYPNVNCIIACNHTNTSYLELQDFASKSFIRLYFADLGRREIRSFTNKWKEVRKSEKDKVIDKVVSLCKQLEIPANYWTVSLLLLVHNKMSNDTSRNLFEVLDLCVDEMLNKKFVVLTKSRIKFEQLKKICSELAYRLLKDHRKDIYSANYVILATYIENYLSKNPRISADTKEVLDYLITSGILKVKADNLYSFRLNGIFEYFLANYITYNESFKDEIINDDKIFLSFKNELEIYSGLKNDDEVFLNRIYGKTKIFFSELNSKYKKSGETDTLLSEKVQKASQLADIAKRFIASGPLDKETQDEMIEELAPLAINNDIKPKELFDIQNIDSRLLERYISILARVFKNTDEVKNTELIDEIFDFLLDTYISLGFFMMDEAEDNSRQLWEGNELTDDQVNILQFISNIVPIVTQVSMFDGVGHYNIENIIKAKILKLSENSNSNQYKLMVMYLILIDIDLDKNHQLIDTLIDVINKGILKTTLLFKLNYYLSFKAYDKPELERFLKKRIQTVKFKIDSKSDHGSMQKNLDGKSKTNIIKKGRNK